MMSKPSTRWLAAARVLAMLSLAGCAAPSPFPTATTTLTLLVPSPTGAPAGTPTSGPPTQTSTATPTPFPPSPTPAQSFISAAPVPRPTIPISPETANQVNLLAFWESDQYNSAAAFSPDGRLLAVTSSEGIHFYDGETLEATRFIESDLLLRGLAGCGSLGKRRTVPRCGGMGRGSERSQFVPELVIPRSGVAFLDVSMYTDVRLYNLLPDWS